MTLSTHYLVWAVIGKLFPNFFIITLLGIISHYSLDTLRHGEYVEVKDDKLSFKTCWYKIWLDILIWFSIPMLISFYNWYDFDIIKYILYWMFISAMPDWLTVLYWLFGTKFLELIYKFHSYCHKYSPFSPERIWNLRNSLNDIIISLIAIFLLFINIPVIYS